MRKLVLTVHVLVSVGWLGAVVAFLVLAIVGAKSPSTDVARSVYPAMNTIGLAAIVPASLLALASGIVQSLETPWGLLRHRWVLTKLVLTVLATIALLLHQFIAIAEAARRAAAGVPVGSLGVQLVVDAAIAAVVLVLTTVLSIYKPWGLTRYGQRKRDSDPVPLTMSAKVGIAVAVMLVGAFVALHVAGGGMHHGH